MLRSILKKRDPNLYRPYRVKHYRFVGATASIFSGFMVMLYLIPASGSLLTVQEWIVVGEWAVLGWVFYIVCKRRYDEFTGLGYSDYINMY